MMWIAVLTGAAGTYLAKLAGLCVPPKILADPRMKRVATLLPVALLAALAGTQTFSTDGTLVLDARAAGFGVAVIAVRLRAPFLLVVAAAKGTAAIIRLLT